jgi:hypothetical protein
LNGRVELFNLGRGREEGKVKILERGERGDWMR